MAATPGNLRAVSAAYRRLAAAVEASLSAPPAAVPPPVTTPAPEPVTVSTARRPRRGAKGWKVSFHAAGSDPAAGEVLSAHTTEGAAEGARRRSQQDWESRQQKAEIPRWAFSVVADPEGALGEGHDRAGARARAARLVVRTRPRDHEVTYRRYGDEKRPGWVHVLREDSGITEALSSRWHQGAEGYARSAFLGAAGDHPYAAHLLQDVCNLAELAGCLPAARRALRRRRGLRQRGVEPPGRDLHHLCHRDPHLAAGSGPGGRRRRCYRTGGLVLRAPGASEGLVFGRIYPHSARCRGPHVGRISCTAHMRGLPGPRRRERRLSAPGVIGDRSDADDQVIGRFPV